MKLTGVGNYPVITQQRISNLSECMLMFLGVKDHDVCHLSSKSSEKTSWGRGGRRKRPNDKANGVTALIGESECSLHC